MTGKRPLNLTLTALAINLTNVISLSQTWVAFADELNNWSALVIGIVLWITVNVLLVKAACVDPGFIPR